MESKSQKLAAKEFAARWKGRGYEKGDSQVFWISLLRDVYGVEHPEEYITFEDQVHLDHTSFIDGYIPSTRVMIEQKGIDKRLDTPIRQSDGSSLTPFQQAKRYIAELPVSQHPMYVITCNFAEFWVYDMDKPGGEPEIIKLADLEKDYYRLQFLVNAHDTHIQEELEVSVAAGEIVGKLYDALYARYPQPVSTADLHSLNVLCVRLVFCLYAENSGIFGSHTMFHDYLEGFDTQHIRKAIEDLFETLDQPEDERPKHLKDDDPKRAAFPYVNGGLFSRKEEIDIPPFTDEIRDLLLEQASAGFDWSGISPTIFGAVFESTLNPETRRSGGMHYTSVENIHKIIDPLFLNDLTNEFNEIQQIDIEKTKRKKLLDFQKKLASLTFLDPACGSGNFLTETYLCLRRLENNVLRELSGQITFGEADFNPIQVSLDQFYGIEINDFAVSVAMTALWIAESQMLQETEDIVHSTLDFLPLTTNTGILHENALTMDWNELISSDQLTYIMGNPPFSGARLMGSEQKEDVIRIFHEWKNLGNLDYVCCWFKKATDFIKGTTIRCAFVATNSVCQGESVADLWKPLMEEGVHIDFAYRTFIWDSEVKVKAHVHCVIIGFSVAPYSKEKIIYTEGMSIKAKNINGYLIDADNVFIESRTKPICDVPEIGIGNKPVDGGFYLFTKEEMDEFLRKEPSSKKYFRAWYGSKEFISQKPRYCLWLGDCSPAELQSMPECKKRIEEVREFRLKSKSPGTQKLAEKPTRFHVENMPKSSYIILPKVSSDKRKYIPMGFMSPEVMSSDLVFLIPNATLYDFGVLTSNVHMAWMRTVAGRLKSDYRYSKDIVYNNFPWPDPTPDQKTKIEQTAQGILDARSLYPDSSLADLYDELTMPPDLRKAHQDNDRAVMQSYGFSVKDTTESSCVAELMKMYQLKAGEHK